jgi:EGF domain-specific O-GlcNAc transferase
MLNRRAPWVLLPVFILVFYFSLVRDNPRRWTPSALILHPAPSPEPAAAIQPAQPVPTAPARPVPTAPAQPVPTAGELQPAAAEFSYPQDYYDPPRDDHWCESWFSSKYLDYLASHHVEYCEPDSTSTLKCFRTHHNDPLCLARGVVLDRARIDQGRNDTAMNCRLRNFTTESSMSDALAAELDGIVNVEDMNDYFWDTGVKGQLTHWDMLASGDETASCNAVDNDNKWTILTKREGNNNIWHKLVELWQVLISLDLLQIAINPETKRPYLSAMDVPKVQVIVEDDDDSILEPWWTMLTGSVPLRKSKMEPSCLGNVILPLAGSSSPFWQGHWEPRDCHDTFLLDSCIRRLYRHLGIDSAPPKKDKVTVTLIQRQGSTRKIFNMERYVRRLEQRWPDVAFQIVHLEEVPLNDQVTLFRNTDVLVGTMGAGLTAMLWLERESSAVEFMAPDGDYCGFRNLAKWKKLHYFTKHGIDIQALNQTHEEWVAKAEKSNAKQSGGQQLNGSPEVERRHWQADEWFYIEEDAFITIVEAAIYAQLNKGLAKADVVPRPSG